MPYKTRLQQSDENQKKRKKLRRKLILYGELGIVIIIFLVVIISCSINSANNSVIEPTICFKGNICKKMIVVSEEQEMETGLSNYSSIPLNSSMLFVFKNYVDSGIWMSNMTFPIDIMWLSKKGRILEIVENAQPCVPPMCEIYQPDIEAKYVLEINAGFSENLNLYKGERVKLIGIN